MKRPKALRIVGPPKIELDGRREVGVIVTDPRVVSRMAVTFERDWASTDRAKQDIADAKKVGKAAPTRTQKATD